MGRRNGIHVSSFVNLTKRNMIYEVSFSCNIGATAPGDGQIGLTLNGSPLQETTAIVVTAAAGDVQNVSGSIFIKTCCCDSLNSISLTNTGTTEINVAVSPRLSVKPLRLI